MKIIKNTKFFNIGFFLITTLIMLILNIYPIYFLSRQSPPGRTYSMIHNNVQDFYFYQSLMNEGANGNWLIYDPYTTETHKTSIIFSYFTLAGKIGKSINLPHFYTYHFIRLLSSFVFFAAAYKLIKKLNLSHPNLAWIFFLFTPPLFNGETPFMYWWTGIDPVRRAAYLPHHMFGGFLLIVSFNFILEFFSSKKIKYLIFAALLAPLLAYIHTPSLIILLIVLPPSVILFLLLNFKFIQNSKFKIQNYLYLTAYWIISLLLLAFMVSQTNKGFPWNQYLLWERNLQYPLSKELLGALGILLPLGLLGIITSFLSKKFNRILIAVWFLLPLILIPFASQIGLSNIRLIQGLPYFTLAILSIYGLDYILLLLKPFSGKITNYLPIVISLVFLIYVYPEISWSVKDQIREYSPIFGNTYLDNRLKGAFEYINNNYPPKTTTVATFYAGNYLPVYTHTVSYIGHSGYTSNLARKEPEVTSFFINKMTSQEAKSFLKSNKITLVFQGPEEKSIYKNILYPEVLKPVYDKEEATIYELK